MLVAVKVYAFLVKKNIWTNTLPHLKCIRLVSVGSSFPYINIGGRIILTLYIYVVEIRCSFFIYFFNTLRIFYHYSVDIIDI